MLLLFCFDTAVLKIMVNILKSYFKIQLIFWFTIFLRRFMDPREKGTKLSSRSSNMILRFKCKFENGLSESNKMFSNFYYRDLIKNLPLDHCKTSSVFPFEWSFLPWSESHYCPGRGRKFRTMWPGGEKWKYINLWKIFLHFRQLLA